MAPATTFAAQLLRASADGFAGIAASRLFERMPELVSRYEPNAFEGWREHLRTQVENLAAAAADGVPDAFARHLSWARTAFAARDVPAEHLQASLETLRGVLDSELPTAAARQLAPYFEGALEALAGEVRAQSEIDTGDGHGRLAADYVVDLLAGRAEQARRRVVDAVAGGEPVPAVLTGVLVPALHQIGHRWHRGEIGVAEEHYATGVTRRVMARLLEDAPRAADNGKTVLVACVPGDAHDLAVQLVAGFFALDGWRAIDLGADVPAADLADVTERFAADLVVLSVTLDVQRAACTKAVRAVREARPELPILVGGPAFDLAPDTWRATGADAYCADPAESVREGRARVGLR